MIDSLLWRKPHIYAGLLDGRVVQLDIDGALSRDDMHAIKHAKMKQIQNLKMRKKANISTIEEGSVLKVTQ